MSQLWAQGRQKSNMIYQQRGCSYPKKKILDQYSKVISSEASNTNIRKTEGC